MAAFSVIDLFSEIRNVETRSLKPGDVLFRPGDRASYLFVLEEGVVKLVRYTPEGGSVCLHTALPGEGFAEAALFSETYHCNAEAVKPSIVRCYLKNEILDLLSGHPDRSTLLMALLARQVRSLRFLLEVRGIRSAADRVMEFLLGESHPVRREFVLEGTLKDLAQTLGMAHETLYRVLASLEKEGRIQRKGNRLKIRKP